MSIGNELTFIEMLLMLVLIYQSQAAKEKWLLLAWCVLSLIFGLLVLIGK